MRIFGYYLYLRSVFNFLNISKLNNKKVRKEKIRIGFLVQVLDVLNKSKILIEKLQKDERFEVYVFCIPLDIDCKSTCDINATNEAYVYCKGMFNNVIDTFGGRNKWIDLKAYDLDYVFYPRPYENVYPKLYRSSVVSSYSKVCILLYGMVLTADILKTMLNAKFFKNVYYYFAETIYCRNFNASRFLITHKLSLQKSVFLGMPALEEIAIVNQEYMQGNASAWHFSKSSFKVIWTPRWTTDIKCGGSNFFNYNNILLNFADKHKDIDFLFRPHPLLFKNFIKNGEMTEKEFEYFITEIEKRVNVSLDKEKEYVSTFCESSLLVTDLSSIIPEYFITGKPIIFCAENMYLELAEHTKTILEGCYVVKNKDELIESITMLHKGMDPLRARRLEIINSLFGEHIIGTTDRIVEEIASDYRQTHDNI